MFYLQNNNIYNIYNIYRIIFQQKEKNKLVLQIGTNNPETALKAALLVYVYLK